MRARRLVPILVVAAVVIAMAMLGASLYVKTREALVSTVEDDLRESLSGALAGPVETHGHTRVLIGSSWKQSETVTRQAGGRALITMNQGGLRIELLDDGERLWRLSDPPTPLGPSPRKIDWPLFRANYKVRQAPRRVVAGEPVGGYRLVSRRTGRVAESLWMSLPDWLIVARETYDADGHLVSASEVTELRRIGPTDVQRAISEAVARLPQPPADEPLADAEFTDRAGFTPLRPAYVPSGYEELGLYGQTCPHGRTYAELRYFDGLRVLSVFERPGGGPGGGGGGRGQGRGWRRGQGHDMESPEPALVDEGQAKTVRVRRGGHRIFVTGDLTQEEILRVVNSMP